MNHKWKLALVALALALSLGVAPFADQAPLAQDLPSGAKAADPLESSEEAPPRCPAEVFDAYMALVKQHPSYVFAEAMQIGESQSKYDIEAKVQDALRSAPVYVEFVYRTRAELLFDEIGWIDSPNEDAKYTSFGVEGSSVGVNGYERQFFALTVGTQEEQLQFRLTTEQVKSLRARHLAGVVLRHKANTPIETLDFRRSPLTQVLQDLCEQGDIDFAMSGETVPELSLRLRSKMVRDAIAVAASAAGWKVNYLNEEVLNRQDFVEAEETMELFINRDWYNTLASSESEEITSLWSAFALALRESAKRFSSARPVLITRPDANS
ncbi:MAG: hypothetical protein KDB07_13280 [Planctomycetes bacterium]|nr:hypothetical protein [Planctomycetota bacterium]